MANDTLDRPSGAQPNVSKRTLIRAFESHIIAKEQADNGQDGDEQAPLTLLRGKDGKPRKFVVATTDEAFHAELHEAAKHKIPLTIQLHRMPTDDELDELSRELPVSAAPKLRAVPAPALPPAAPLDGRANVVAVTTEREAKSEPPMRKCGVRHWGDCRTEATPMPGEVPRASEKIVGDTQRDAWTDAAPFMLAIREGRSETRAGPFATVTVAWTAMQGRGAPGLTATIYERGKVAQYRGGRATFETGPRSSTWKRSG